MTPDELDQLSPHCARLSALHLRRLFADDPSRFADLSVSFDDLTLDFSKEKIDTAALAALVAVADRAGVADRRDAMFAGEPINKTEGRAVLHAALRGTIDDGFQTGGRAVGDDVEETRNRFLVFADQIRDGVISATDGSAFADVVNIGIGGSDLGPSMVTQGLSGFVGNGPNLHFVSNIDGAHITDILRKLDPARTLVIIASKSFTTQETLTNAAAARDWLCATLGADAASAHLVAVSSNIAGAAELGIPVDRVFGFWDWVGGRYSVWSSVGLAVAIAIGSKNFRDFLAGARAMDQHFQTAALSKNLPVLLALIGIWRRNVLQYPTLAIVPYAQRLSLFPAYIQQLDMESNGKSVGDDGAPLGTSSAPVIWGESGTNAQHSFFQLLHQGTDIVPVDFILAAETDSGLGDQHTLLRANCLAQSEALAFGRTELEVRRDMRDAGVSKPDIDRLAVHRSFAGDRPSTTILQRRLDPFSLGRLIALYEHKVFVQGVIWGVNSFDQWGVELGKKNARDMTEILCGMATGEGKDSSTRGLVEKLDALRES